MKLRAAEVVGVVERIKVAIAHYGLTAEQLGLTSSKQAKAGRGAAVQAEQAAIARKRRTKSANVPGIAKYGDDTGKTWTGNGKRPKWFLDAIASGKTPEDLLIAAK